MPVKKEIFSVHCTVKSALVQQCLKQTPWDHIQMFSAGLVIVMELVISVSQKMVETLLQNGKLCFLTCDQHCHSKYCHADHDIFLMLLPWLKITVTEMQHMEHNAFSVHNCPATVGHLKISGCQCFSVQMKYFTSSQCSFKIIIIILQT